MAKKKKKDWRGKLSPISKAEILAGVIHTLTSRMPDVWAKIPLWYQQQIKRAMSDCSIDLREFELSDMRQVREYFKEFKKNNPTPQPNDRTY